MRLVANHSNRLEQHYGHDHLRHFQIRILALMASVFSLVLLGLSVSLMLIDSSLIAPQTKLVFVPIKLAMVVAFVASYLALLKGREALARRLMAATVVGGVTLAVALTGGFPASPAAATLLLPAILFYCLYGGRAGALMALLMPGVALALFLANKVSKLALPNFASAASPDLNLGLSLLACHIVAVLAVASYERNNRLLSQRLDAELAKHAELANRDALTGLGNARFFDLELKRVLAKPRTAAAGVAVIYCDLDDFKPINDSHGHSVGDQVLAAIGKRFQSLTKQGIDIAARIGGDEFAIILVSCACADVPLVCARIRNAVTAPIVLQGTTFRVGISIGQAYAPIGTNDASELIRQADIDMYRDKEQKPRRPVTPNPPAGNSPATATV